MKSLNKKIVLFGVSSLIGIGSLSLKSPTAIAQQEVCRDALVEASEEMRTVELPQFGIDIDIPANYRAIAFDKDHIGIMNPGNWELLQCIERGGEVLFPRGSFGFNIYKSDYLTPQAALEAQKEEPYYSTGTIYTYYLGETEVLIEEHESGMEVSAFFSHPDIKGVTIMNLICDCELTVETIVRELDRTRLRD